MPTDSARIAHGSGPPSSGKEPFFGFFGPPPPGPVAVLSPASASAAAGSAVADGSAAFSAADLGERPNPGGEGMGEKEVSGL